MKTNESKSEGTFNRLQRAAREADRDAALEAAAPDLLQACRSALSAITFGGGREIDWNAIADELRSAIQKATAK